MKILNGMKRLEWILWNYWWNAALLSSINQHKAIHSLLCGLMKKRRKLNGFGGFSWLFFFWWVMGWLASQGLRQKEKTKPRREANKFNSTKEWNNERSVVGRQSIDGINLLMKSIDEAKTTTQVEHQAAPLRGKPINLILFLSARCAPSKKRLKLNGREPFTPQNKLTFFFLSSKTKWILICFVLME